MLPRLQFLEAEEMTEQFYDTLHESYFPITGPGGTSIAHVRRERCLSIIDQCKPRAVLEVGFENPHLSKSIADLPGVEYVGVDVSEVSVKTAREIGLSAFRVDVSEERLPFDDQAFDLVYCAEVLEHLFNPDLAAEEFTRVLRPNGKLLITTPNLASWYNRIILLLGLQPVHTEISTWRILGRKFAALGQGNRPVGHLRLFTLAGLIEFLSLHGLKNMTVEGYYLDFHPKLWLLDAVMSKFTSLASGFIVLCQRREARTQPRSP